MVLSIINAHIDQSGRVVGLIDFEATIIAPQWECTVIPRWLQDADDPWPESRCEGRSSEVRSVLHAASRIYFSYGSVRPIKWTKAYDVGHPFRRFINLLYFQASV
ncbi:hypothetical protein DEU56DRAFT_480314 [Suillus clintonianus]|uniref:uncharacterized protein n=1 Tax=Suillus clintonianus TaxID=1904413 RepID=UPI001B860BC3|nr:uncharacterized protein DEU56DRAFT_480314 [Suillus clintonianus]KAG2153339.1 hypothetical protein DEU56DRAFT_480314 [Suillus clintonianus]